MITRTLITLALLCAFSGLARASDVEHYKKSLYDEMKRHHGAVRACFEKHKAATQSSKLAVVIHVKISDSGEIVGLESDPKRTLSKNKALIGCIRGTIYSWTILMPPKNTSFSLTTTFAYSGKRLSSSVDARGSQSAR